MIFTKEEYNSRLIAIKQQMNKRALEILIITDPSNMNYTTGYDGYSFYVPQGVIISLDYEEPIWFGRMQDSKGAKVTTFLKEENILDDNGNAVPAILVDMGLHMYHNAKILFQLSTFPLKFFILQIIYFHTPT